ncbi:hypothetical protein BJX64DRAFT_293057 [Aspergillus heterothallicus]
MAAPPPPAGGPGGPPAPVGNEHFRQIMDNMRQVPGAGTAGGGFTLWGGVIMSMLPGANNGSDMKPLFDSFLSSMNWVEVLVFLEAFPAHLAHVLRWGRGPGGSWHRMAVLSTPQDVVDWHKAVAPRGTVFTPGHPIPLTVSTKNIQACPTPMASWILADRHSFLIRLHRIGLWNPLGYVPSGESFLAFAMTHNNTWNNAWAIDYINNIARNNLQFLLQPAIIQEVTGIALNMNHFDYAIREGHLDIFFDWLAAHPGINGPTILNLRSRETLTKTINAAAATHLLTNHNLNLAIQPAAPAAMALNPRTPAGNGYLIGYVRKIGSPGYGSPWHLAVQNPNLDMLDFMNQHSPNPPIDIDNPAGFAINALRLAYHRQLWPQFQHLLALGADTLTLPLVVLRTWPHYRDRWFRAIFDAIPDPNPNPGGAVWLGTGYHWVLYELYRRLREVRRDTRMTRREKNNTKRRMMAQAEKLLVIVGRGNARGVPDLKTTDIANNRTAWQFARRQGWSQFGYSEFILSFVLLGTGLM